MSRTLPDHQAMPAPPRLRDCLRAAIRNRGGKGCAARWTEDNRSVIQPITGFLLWNESSARFDAWLAVVLSLYVFVGLCWLPVVALQMRLRDRGMPYLLQRLYRWEVLLSSFSSRSEENARQAREFLFSVQNSRKARDGGPALAKGVALVNAQRAAFWICAR